MISNEAHPPVAGSDRLGPRVEEVWVWKLKMRRDDAQVVVGSQAPTEKNTSNYWILYDVYKFIYVLFNSKRT